MNNQDNQQDEQGRNPAQQTGGQAEGERSRNQHEQGTGGQDGSQTGATGLGTDDQAGQQEQADYGSQRGTGQDGESRQTDTGIGQQNDDARRRDGDSGIGMNGE